MGITRNPNVRRLLVITYHFPPDGAIGGQRWAGLSKYLARLGWEVHVITAAAGGPQQPSPGVHQHFCCRRRTLNDVYKTVAGRLKQRSNGNGHRQRESQGRPRSLSPMRPIAALRRIVGSSMYLPDNGRGWVTAAASAARALLRERSFDFVITSGPPHSAHFAGLAATLGRSEQFWIDMRDPWSLIHEVRPGDDWFVPTERFVLQRLERLALAHAARIIVNTPQFASALGDAKPDLKVMCLPNGVDLEYPTPRDVSSVERGSIAYVGTLYYGRNLSSVCAAMRLLLNDRPEAAATLRLNVAGPMDSPHRRRFEDEIAAGELTSVVNIHGVLPRAQALELLSRASLALVLAQDQPMQIPAKLYESVALGIPTLVIAEEMSAAACEARRIGAMTLDGADVEGLRALFEDLLAGRLPTKIEAKAPIDYAHLAQQWDGILRDSLKAESDGVEHPRFVPTEGV